MAESENKRTRRTPQERAAEVDEKIAKIDESIKEQSPRISARAVPRRRERLRWTKKSQR